MTADEIRRKYIEYFISKGHKQIPPASLVPADDPTTLFTGFGMQQLVPYLKGQPHPMGKRLVNSQPCFRAEDINEVGDNRHTTFFEMLGNWSLGDYFKKQQLTWFFEYLTNGLSLDPDRLYVTIFEGNRQIPKDHESISIWQHLFNSDKPAQAGKKGFNPEIKIYTYDASKNWWSRSGVPETMPTGEIGGPDSEVFFDFGAELRIHEQSSLRQSPCHLNCNCGRFLEIGNSVFMEYEKQEDGSFKLLPSQNVDFGGGLERICAVVQNKLDVFQTELFQPVIKIMEQETNLTYKQNSRTMRVITDHLKGAAMIAAEGVLPSNKEQGSFLRRLVRRAMLEMRQAEIEYTNPLLITKIVRKIFSIYEKPYPHLLLKVDAVSEIITKESRQFDAALKQGIKKLQQQSFIDGKVAFDLYQSYGLPLEVTRELLQQMGKTIDEQRFAQEFKHHQEISRAGAIKKFKGGLADHSEATTKLHTATHLLHQALRILLGKHVRQVGSNITAKRLRFDFNHPKSLTDTELKMVESLINQKIQEDLPVTKTVEEKNEALKSGALAFFKETYPERVSVYTIGENPKKSWFSKELCGGPHVKTTIEIGALRITKQESIGAGVRRLYAELA